MSVAYLTIDDGPSENLPEKLDILETYDVPALFFCEGRRLAEYPEHAGQAIESGFHLGNHTYSHRRASDLSVEAFRDELDRTESLLEDVYDRSSVSRPARTFRFPYGDKGDDEGNNQAEQFQQILEEYGFTPPDSAQITYDWYDEDHADDFDWFWTIDLEDWQVESEAELRARVESATDRFDHPSPDIVLFHDDGNTAELFEAFVELLLETGVEFAAPTDLLP